MKKIAGIGLLIVVLGIFLQGKTPKKTPVNIGIYKNDFIVLDTVSSPDFKNTKLILAKEEDNKVIFPLTDIVMVFNK
jgi:hypothetical protein